MATKSKAERISKISPAAVMGLRGGITEGILEQLIKSKTLVAYDVFGVVSGFKVIPPKGDYNEAIRFIGNFKAVNRMKGGDNPVGAEFTSSRAYFPAWIEEELHAKLAGGARGVELAIRIGIKFDAKAIAKYIYTAEALIEMEEGDALKALEQRARDGIKQLAAPAKE